MGETLTIKLGTCTMTIYLNIINDYAISQLKSTLK